MRDLISAFSGPVSGFPAPFGRHRSWSGTSLFANGEQGALYLPGPDTCFQDAAGSTPAGDGDPVGYLSDLSGNGNHATQSTSAARPTLVQDGGGNWYLDFDGVDDCLSHPLSVSGPLSLAAAARRTGGSGRGQIYAAAGPSTPLTALLWGLTNSGPNWGTYAGSERNSGVSLLDNTAVIVNIGASSTSQKLYTNGEFNAEYSPAYAGDTNDRRFIGKENSIGRYYMGYVYWIVSVGRALTDTERSATEQYLANLSGVTL